MGDPHCLPTVHRAKCLKAQIIELMDGTDLASAGSDANDEDQLPSLDGDDIVIGGEGGVDELLQDDGVHPDDEAAAATAGILAAPVTVDEGEGRPSVSPSS